MKKYFSPFPQDKFLLFHSFTFFLFLFLLFSSRVYIRPPALASSSSASTKDLSHIKFLLPDTCSTSLTPILNIIYTHTCMRPRSFIILYATVTHMCKSIRTHATLAAAYIVLWSCIATEQVIAFETHGVSTASSYFTLNTKIPCRIRVTPPHTSLTNLFIFFFLSSVHSFILFSQWTPRDLYWQPKMIAQFYLSIIYQ